MKRKSWRIKAIKTVRKLEKEEKLTELFLLILPTQELGGRWKFKACEMGWFFLLHALRIHSLQRIVDVRSLHGSTTCLPETLNEFLKYKLTGFRSVGFRAAKCQKPVDCSGELSLYLCPYSYTPPKAKQTWVTWLYVNLPSDPVLLISCSLSIHWVDWIKNHWGHLKLTFFSISLATMNKSSKFLVLLPEEQLFYTLPSILFQFIQ